MDHESFHTGSYLLQIKRVYNHKCIRPQGLLREDDLEHFDEDFRKNFKTRQADIFSEDGWEGDDQIFFHEISYYATRWQFEVTVN